MFEWESAIFGATWLLRSLEWLLGGSEDTNWGATRCSRILYYMEVAVEMTANADALSETRRLATMRLCGLRDR
jgi:hypothetical protein